MERRVVIDGHVGGVVEDLEQAGIVGDGADGLEHVVLHEQSLGLQARGIVVEARDVDAAARVTDDVVRERHVLDDRPGRRAIVVAHRELQREPGLGRRPHVLEQVAVHEDPLHVLELEQVLDHPQDARKARVVGLPAQRLEEMIVADLDVGRHEVGDGRAGPAEQQVLGGRLQVIVPDR